MLYQPSRLCFRNPGNTLARLFTARNARIMWMPIAVSMMTGCAGPAVVYKGDSRTEQSLSLIRVVTREERGPFRFFGKNPPITQILGFADMNNVPTGGRLTKASSVRVPPGKYVISVNCNTPGGVITFNSYHQVQLTSEAGYDYVLSCNNDLKTPGVYVDRRRKGTDGAPIVTSDQFGGFLCCNMRTDGRWISDINYVEGKKSVIPAGTPVQVTSFGRDRANVTIEGQEQSIGNDYSRDLPIAVFARRYVIDTDPKPALASAPASIRRAIESSRVSKGMTRPQVVMALGYPITSENPSLDGNPWRFWRSSDDEFQVYFDSAGNVEKVTGDPQVVRQVWMD